MESFPLKQILADAERLIVRGQIKAASEIIARAELSPNTRLETFELARIFRRMGNPENTLRMLAPVVRPKVALLKPASEDEKLEYAIALQRVGSLQEATDILESLNAETTPEALLVESVFLFSKWNYADSIPKLQQYLSRIPQDSYSARLGKVNLAAALVHERRSESQSLLEELIRETTAREEYLLLGNALEISAQSAVFVGDLNRAEKLLQQIDDLLSGVKILDFLWLVKWKSLVKALRNRSTEPLEEIRQEALRKKHWETLREVDYYRLQIQYSEDVFLKLYYGTKSPHYRARIRKMFPQAPVLPAISMGSDRDVRSPNGNEVEIFSFPGELAPGTTAHALLVYFLSDSYRGFRSGELYSILFPGDFYNPDTSLNRVHQTISRFRKTLAEYLPFLEIEVEDNIYRLKIYGSERILLPPVLPEPGPLAIKLFLFLQGNSEEIFSSEDVQVYFKITKANANKLLTQWVDAKLIDIHLQQRPRLYKKRSL